MTAGLAGTPGWEALDVVLSGRDCFGGSICLPVSRWQRLDSGLVFVAHSVLSLNGEPGGGEVGLVPRGSGACTGLGVEDGLQTARDLAAWHCQTLSGGEPWVTGKPHRLRPKAAFGEPRRP